MGLGCAEHLGVLDDLAGRGPGDEWRRARRLVSLGSMPRRLSQAESATTNRPSTTA